MLNNILAVAGAAVEVADLAEELCEFVESLGPDTLEVVTQTDEYLNFRDTVDAYVQTRDSKGELHEFIPGP